MPYADIDALCNAALNYLGEPDATPFDEDAPGTTVRDRACQRHYTNALQSVLFHHRWDFATVIAELALTDPQPDPAPDDFPHAYALPSDCLRFHEIILTNGTRLTHFRRIGTNIFLDSDSYLGKIIYTIDDIAPPDMPPSFADCVMMELAKRIAPSIVQNPQLMEKLAGHPRETFARAIATETRETQSNENSSPLALAHQSSVFLSRFRR